MQEPPWMPRTEEEYRQQVAEDAGPQPDEFTRLQHDLDVAESTAQMAAELAASLSQDWHRIQKAMTRLRAAAVDLTTAYLEDPHVTLDELKPRILHLIETLDGVAASDRPIICP